MTLARAVTVAVIATMLAADVAGALSFRQLWIDRHGAEPGEVLPSGTRSGPWPRRAGPATGSTSEASPGPPRPG